MPTPTTTGTLQKCSSHKRWRKSVSILSLASRRDATSSLLFVPLMGCSGVRQLLLPSDSQQNWQPNGNVRTCVRTCKCVDISRIGWASPLFAQHICGRIPTHQIMQHAGQPYPYPPNQHQTPVMGGWCWSSTF
jgi:hypothetical protein